MWIYLLISLIFLILALECYFKGGVNALVTLIGVFLDLDPIFYLGLGAATLTAIYQLYLCKDRDRQRCFKAFLNNIWFGGFVFVGLWLAYL